ncbi:hypothetical protein quinque_009868 [Culex quinquefasciatus]|uniref:neuronal acetylcholine receptor subunit alpha-2 n=1 Tax=Culex quinquefasciatus TaxID=7176 RepID=UPI0018E33E5E|nr:neuronal acetylcholine receptor subunit alpha-2 [Culex quinquefasciatus]
MLISFNYDSDDNTLNINMALMMRWTDEFLKWDAKDYENITSLIVRTDEIWIPDFRLFSSYYKPDTEMSCTNPRCLTFNDGQVTCVPACDFTARCEADYTRWPLDSQQCRLYYGSWMEHSDEVDFHSRVSYLWSHQTNANTQWRIVSSKVSKQTFAGKGNVTYPTLVYDYVIERHSSFHLAALFTPILMLLCLNLFITWVSTDCLERKVLLAVSIFCHFQFMALLKWTVPKSGDSVPGLLLFFRNSLIITCLLLIHTAIGTWVKKLNRAPPALVTLLTGTAMKNKVGELFLAGDYMNVEYKKSEVEQKPAIDSEHHTVTWEAFSKVMDRVLFIVYLASYGLFCVMYISFQYAKQDNYELHILGYRDINQIEEIFEIDG